MLHQYLIRPMTRSELDMAVDWAVAEGWNPGLYDADCFFAADPSGYWMGELDGEPISSLSAVKYGSSFGFVGFYIVKPEFRGMGYGFKLWQAGLESLQGRVVGLDGVVAQQANYIKSGFDLAYRNIRYEGFGRAIDTSAIQSEIVPLASLSVDAIIEYDRAFFPGDRSVFLKCWLGQPDSHTVGAVRDGELVGYGMRRVCRNGHKIGPLFADSPQIAEDIYVTLAASVTLGDSFYLDVPEVNLDAVGLAERYDMRSMFETARMYIGAKPDLSLDRTFGVTTFELG